MNFSLPKPLIRVIDRPILFWLLDSLDFQQGDLIVIPYHNDILPYRLEDLVRHHYPHLAFFFYRLLRDTRGCAETVLDTLLQLRLDSDLPVISIDGDNFCSVPYLEEWEGQGMILCAQEKHVLEPPPFSYVRTSSVVVEEIREKERISSLACCGVYAFASTTRLLTACTYIIENNIRDKNEFYMSTVVNHMIQNGGERFVVKEIGSHQHHCLGTPFHVRLFCGAYPELSCSFPSILQIKKRRYCFDLDNTLVTFPRIPKDYTTVEPIKHNILAARKLKSMGHTIIIHTARRMQTFGSNVGAVVADIGRITLDTLDRFQIPYDEVVFGKPLADIYVDDLALASFGDVTKELGIFHDMVETRSFNTIQEVHPGILRKSSVKDLAGEIEYYKAIPASIADVFPAMHSYDTERSRWYEVEKIHGVNLSIMYTSQELSEDTLRAVLTQLHRVHCHGRTSHRSESSNLNLIPKITERYQAFPYAEVHPASHEVFVSLLEGLSHYKDTQNLADCMIHGDPVFTNVILSDRKEIKFIDMRGKNGELLTVRGDPLYDYGKILQSLVGYDEVLQSLVLPSSYRERMLAVFWSFFGQHYADDLQACVKLITRSLFFSLIPLHDHNRRLFFDLIQSVHLQ